MIHRLASVAPMVFLIVLAAASFWLEQAVQPGQVHQGSARHDPDFWAESVTAQRYDADGKLQNTLTARRLAHYPDNDTTVVESPLLSYHRQPLVTVAAAKGLIGKEGKEVVLLGNATITRGGRDKTPPTHVITEALNILPDEEKAFSRHPVTISQGRSIIHGSGMQIDSRSGISVLSGRVNGIIYKKQ